LLDLGREVEARLPAFPVLGRALELHGVQRIAGHDDDDARGRAGQGGEQGLPLGRAEPAPHAVRRAVGAVRAVAVDEPRSVAGVSAITDSPRSVSATRPRRSSKRSPHPKWLHQRASARSYWATRSCSVASTAEATVPKGRPCQLRL